MSEYDDDTSESDQEYDSGPHCRHWGDPSDCDEPCARCGHLCYRHGNGGHYGDACDDCEACDTFLTPEPNHE